MSDHTRLHMDPEEGEAHDSGTAAGDIVPHELLCFSDEADKFMIHGLKASPRLQLVFRARTDYQEPAQGLQGSSLLFDAEVDAVQ